MTAQPSKLNDPNAPAVTEIAGGTSNAADSDHAPAAPASGTRWEKFRLIFKVVEVRLRFIAIVALIAFFVGYWDTIKNHWEKATGSDGGVYRTVRGVFGDGTARWLWPQAVASDAADSNTEYYCPMHPNVIRQGLDPTGAIPKCPICGMPLSLRRKGEMPKLPEGVLSRKQLSPEQIQLAGIKTVTVAYQPLTKELTTVGYVGYDESRRSRIVSRVAGYLEKLYVDRSWTSVKEGDPLGEIFSPELYSTVREVLQATERGANSALAKSGREKLRLLGVSDQEIDEIVQSGRANHRLVLRSPRTGHVIRKEVVEGGHIDAGQTLFEIADLTQVWIEAEVYQADIELIHEGQAVEATVESFRNRPFSGRVSLVHPHLDPITRTNSVRFELENPGHKLRPGMFVTVRIKTSLSDVEPFASLASQSLDDAPLISPGEVLAVPERAVIDTGSKQIVYVEREPGQFEGVQVELGPRAGGFYSVIKGVKAGDRIAAAGSFLIDAETRLNPAATAAYLGAGGGPANARVSKASGAGTKAAPESPNTKRPKPTADQLKFIDKLTPADRELALAQRLCPVSGEPLGSMGIPHKVTIKGQTIFLCCKGCDSEANQEPDKVLKKLAELKAEK